MAIPIVKVNPGWFSMILQGHSLCHFCRQYTHYIFYPEWVSVCPECAKTHSVDDILAGIKE